MALLYSNTINLLVDNFFSGNTYHAQSFVATSDSTVTSIEIYLSRFPGGSVNTATLYLVDDDGGGLPDMSNIKDSDTVTGIGTSASWVSFAISTTLTDTNRYWIVVAALTSDRNIRWWRSSYTTWTHSTSTDAGSSWSGPSTSWTDGIKVYGVAKPGKPTNPSPSDTASSITLDETLSWDASSPAADTYEIYFREQGDDWGLVGVAQPGVTYDLDFGTLDYDTTYEWRIDATNAYGTVTGDTWSFDTIVFDTVQPGASGGAGGGGGGGGSGEESSPNGENNMITLRRLVAAAANKIWYEDI